MKTKTRAVRRYAVLAVSFMVLTTHFTVNADAGLFDVTAYGAMGNGSANDTVAIQAAVTAAGEKGGNVYFPKGIYLVSAPIELGSHVRLSGGGAASKLRSALTGKDRALFLGENAVGVHIVDLGFEGMGGEVPVIELRGAKDCSIMGNAVKDMPIAVLKSAEGEEGVLFGENISIRNNSLNGSGKTDFAVRASGTDFVSITGNGIAGYKNGIVLKDTGERLPVRNVCAENLLEDIEGDGIHVGGNEMVTIGGNTVKGAGMGIALSESIYVSVLGNVLSDSGIVANGGRGININANDVYDEDDKTPLLEIRAEIGDVNITGNTFRNNGEGRCFIGGGAAVLSVSGNHCYNTYMDFAGFESAMISGNQLVFEGAYDAGFTALAAGGATREGRLMLQNNQIVSADDPPAGSVGIVVSQCDDEFSSVSYIKGNSIKGFPVDIRLLADSANPSVRPVFMVKGNCLGAGRFERQEGHTQSSVCVLEDNYTDSGGNWPSAVPAMGKWDKGQIIYFDEPAEYVGAVCIAKGSPGVWRYFGKID